MASYNLVPLVGVDVVEASPDSNAAHSSIVEGQARSAFKSLSAENESGSSSPTGPRYSGLRYGVRVTQFGGHDVSTITSQLNEVKLRLAVYLSLAAKQLEKVTEVVTLNELKDYLGRNATALNPAMPQRYEKEWSNGAKPYVQTVWDTDQGEKPVQGILGLIDENIELWKWEAEKLPVALYYYFEIGYSLWRCEWWWRSRRSPCRSSSQPLPGL